MILNELPSKKTFEEFETKYGLKVPLSFKSMHNVPMFNLLMVTVFDEILNHNFQISTVRLSCQIESLYEEVLIDSFLPFNIIVKQWENHIQDDTLWSNYKILPFAYLAVPAHTRLFIGVSEENYGKIFVNSNDEMIFKLGNKVYELFPDYLDFLENCELVINEDRLQQIAGDTSKLYKCWQEDFWRIKR